MSRLSCTFCEHRNPQGSRFCNQCGSPLHLVPCAQCEAINNASETHCYACGAPLAELATAEMATAGFAESTQGAGVYAASGGSAPVTLADHLEAVPWDLPLRSRASEPIEPAPTPATAGADTGNRADDVAGTYRHIDYHARKSRWPKRIVLGCAVLAIAGAIYWSTRETLESPESAAPEAPASTQQQPPAAADAQPAAAASSSQADANSAPAAPVTETAPTNESVAPAAETAASNAESASPPAQSTAPPVESAPAPAAAPVAAPEVKSARTPAGGPARTASEASRRASAQRTREQALRDAQATQRLIERDLGITPRSDSSSAPTTPR